MSVLSKYINDFTPHLSMRHWIVIVVISLVITILLLKRHRVTFYSVTVLGIATLIGLFLLDALTINRMGNRVPIQYSGFNLRAELDRLIKHANSTQISMFFNVIAFIPFGMSLSEFFSGVKRFSCKCCLRNVSLIAFGLSFSIEILQFVLKVGFLELTDMILNTLGAVLGALIVLGLRMLPLFSREKHLTII